MRGVCRPCYFRLRKLVVAGRATWESFEEAGKSLPAVDPVEGRKKWIRLPFKMFPVRGDD